MVGLLAPAEDRQPKKPSNSTFFSKLFSRANKPPQNEEAYRLRRNSTGGPVLKGHGFSRAAKSLKTIAALAAEGWFLPLSAIHSGFLAASVAPEELSCWPLPGYTDPKCFSPAKSRHIHL
jgi:hypothetical protein